MITEKKIDLYKYFNLPRPEGAKGYLNSYVLERSEEYSANRVRPAMIVFPGGGYWMRSDRENEPVALSYLAKGFNAFTVEYTVGKESDNAHMPVMLIEACMAVAFVRENADKYFIRKDKIGVIGFSAGGHLAGSVTTMWSADSVKNALGEKYLLSRPDVAVLCYPVISFTYPTHGGTRDWATGSNPELYYDYSIEQHVTKDTPPCFIWTTSGDTCVPPINSIIMAKALTENGVPFDLHIFNQGEHGSALANRETARSDTSGEILPIAESWFEQSIKFLTGLDFKVVD